MVIRITMEVEGLEAVIDTVNIFGSREKMEKAVNDLGEIGLMAAAGGCPVDTGALLHSINHFHSGLTSIVSAGIYYAIYVEFGVQSRPTYPAQPFMRPAAEQVRSVASSIEW